MGEKRKRRMDALLVAAILADLVPKPDVASSEDTPLRSSHHHLVVGKHLLYRLHHSLWKLLAPHLSHHLLVHLPCSERHLSVRWLVRVLFSDEVFTRRLGGGGGEERRNEMR